MNFLNIDPAAVDPNLVYLIVVAGLWIGVTAIYTPGTGLLEVISIAALIGGLMFLSVMPTNWVAVLVLVFGVLSFIVMPFIKRQFAPLAVVGLGLQAVGGVLMFNGLAIPWLLVVFTVGVSLLYFRFVLLPALNKMQEEPSVLYNDTILGAHGRVLTPLNPLGTVQLRGETWTASSEKPVEKGEEVVVVDRQGLQLLVEAMKHKREREENQEEAL